MSALHITFPLIVWKKQAHSLSYSQCNAVSWLVKLQDHLSGQSGKLVLFMKDFFLWEQHRFNGFIIATVPFYGSADKQHHTDGNKISHLRSEPLFSTCSEAVSPRNTLDRERCSLMTDIQRKMCLKWTVVSLQFTVTWQLVVKFEGNLKLPPEMKPEGKQHRHGDQAFLSDKCLNILKIFKCKQING